MCKQVKPIERAVAEAFPMQTEDSLGLLAGNKELLRPSHSRKVTVKLLVEMPEWKGVFTESAIRALIDKARPRFSSRGVIRGNGLAEAGALIRIGRRILIDCDKFREWVEAHRVTSESADGPGQ